jgi:hypothetical protein
MITSIEIEGLRGIREGKIEGLAPLTFLVGPNGCGKSTVLEAVGVACAGLSMEDLVRALLGREWLGLAGLRYCMVGGSAKISSTFGPAGPVNTTVVSLGEIVPRVGDEDDGPRIPVFAELKGTRTWAFVDEDGLVVRPASADRPPLAFVTQGAFVDRPAGAARRFSLPHFSSAHREALTTIKLSPWYDQLFSYLQVLRPSLTSIESIAVGDRDEPHAFERDPKHGRVGYPLAYAGDGFRRSLLLAGTFARAKGGVAAIDEPEAFANPGMFDALTGLLKRAVADGTQVMLATHSLEFVAAALRGFEDQPDKAAVVGLRMESGVLDPVVIAGPDAHRRVVELGHDLRI